MKNDHARFVECYACGAENEALSAADMDALDKDSWMRGYATALANHVRCNHDASSVKVTLDGDGLKPADFAPFADPSDVHMLRWAYGEVSSCAFDGKDGDG